MEVRPILSTLRRHKTAAALMVLEIAVTCAILCNAVFLIADILFRGWWAALTAALLAGGFAWFWYGLPLLRR